MENEIIINVYNNNENKKKNNKKVMNEINKMKQNILKNENSNMNIMKNKNEWNKMKKDILNELYFKNHIRGNLIEIKNIYKLKNKYHVEFLFKDKSNQNSRLQSYLQRYFQEFPHFSPFLIKNFKRKEPLLIELYFTKDNVPIILVNKRGFNFIDFNAYLNDPSIQLNQFTFTSDNPNKLF